MWPLLSECFRCLSYFSITLLAKLAPLAYGIFKLQISCVIEDEKIGTDFLEESITAFEDLVGDNWMAIDLCLFFGDKLLNILSFLQVQSVDIVAFNKI